MSTATPLYGTTTAMTMTLTGLATAANLDVGRQSTAIDNTSNDDMDALVGGKITTGTSPTASRQIEVWVFGSYDDTEYSGGAGASDAGLTPDTKYVLRQAWIIPTANTSDKAYRWGPVSIAALFDGIMPERWGIWITHNTGVNLNATAANHEAYYTPVNYEAA